MIRKSTDSRDWLTASEPRGVRPAIKRILEEITRVDSHASQLYEEGSRKERSSDSSRRTHHRLLYSVLFISFPYETYFLNKQLPLTPVSLVVRVTACHPNDPRSRPSMGKYFSQSNHH